MYEGILGTAAKATKTLCATNLTKQAIGLNIAFVPKSLVNGRTDDNAN